MNRPGILGGDRPVVVAVVGRVGRHRVDLARVRVHDHGRRPLGPIRDPRGEEFLLDPQLESGVDRELEVLAGAAGLADDGLVEIRDTAGITLGHDRAWLAGQGGLVGLLHPVLPEPFAVDEP